MSLHDVPADAYRDVLDMDVSADAVGDTVDVDRRGYAPAVADELGDDYLDGTILLFGEDQRYADLQHEDYSFIDDLLDWTYGHPFITEYAESQPVRLDIDITPMPNQYHVQATVDSTTAQEHFAEARETQQRIKGLTSDEFLNDEYIEELAEQADTALDRFGGLEELSFDETIVQDTVPSFMFTLNDTDGYMFTAAQTDAPSLYTGFGEQPYAVFIGETQDDLFDFPYTAVDATAQLDNVIQLLHTTDELTIDMGSVTDRMDDLMQSTAGTDEEDDTQFYLSKEFKETGRNTEALPQEYWVLQDLADDRDISVTEPADLAKLPHFTGETSAAASLLTELQGLDTDVFQFPETDGGAQESAEQDTSTERTYPDEIRDISEFISEYMETDETYNQQDSTDLPPDRW